jgi:hypothetical protein
MGSAEKTMKLGNLLVVVAAVLSAALPSVLSGQEPKATPSPSKPPVASQAQDGRQYSGMYSFLSEGEFVQITVEDQGKVAGFVSRYGDGPSDKGGIS